MELIKRATGSRTVQIIAAILFGVVALVHLGIVPDFPSSRLDLDVYRLGGQAWLNGQDLYGQLPPTQSGMLLPFTYPPIAAIGFSVLAWMPPLLASILLSAVSIAALFAVIWLVTRELSDLSGPQIVWFSLIATTMALLVGPPRETIWMGQINICLMALVVVDMLVGKGKWWHGSLIGLAAAIKLVPAVFFLYFLLRKDVRAILVGGFTFLACHAIGFCLAWDDSVTYWTSAIIDPSRVGNPAYAANQSINGFIRRFDFPGVTAQVLWAGLVAIAVAVTTILMVRLLRRQQNFAAVVVVAFAGLLTSPVSWGHHWVWSVPALIMLVLWLSRERERLGPALTRVLWGIAIVGAAIFMTSPYWWFPHGSDLEVEWLWYMHIFGNAFVLWTLALFAAIWWFTLRIRPDKQP